MALTTRAALAATWLLGIGLFCVYFEVRNVHCGVRIRQLLEDESRLIENVRHKQLEYYNLLSRDLLEESMARDGILDEFYRQPQPDGQDDPQRLPGSDTEIVEDILPPGGRGIRSAPPPTL